jgi:hypothetical protein
VFDTDTLTSERDPGGTSSGGASSSGNGGGRDADGILDGTTTDAEPENPGTDASLLDAVADTGLQSDASAPFFVDEFMRADSTDIGNGWTEKNPPTFRISGQRALKQVSTVFYRDNLVYRTATMEQDVEVSATFVPTNATPGSPQVHARIQPSTAATLNTLECYLVFVDDGSNGADGMQAILARQKGTTYSTQLQKLAFEAPLVAGTTYRLRLRVAGTNPVRVAAAVDRMTGPSSFVLVAQAAVDDFTTDRISTAGYIGFSGDKAADGTYAYTRFEAARIP